MTFAEICRFAAERFGWPPQVVGDMTPYQISMYATSDGRYSLAGLNAIAAGANTWHADARFPGKKMRTFSSFAEAQAFIRQNRKGD